jgi:hypothetical protein
MNMARLALAAVAATIVDGIYGFAVYGNALGNLFMAFPGVFRPTETQTMYLPVMFCGILVGMFAATFIYAKGYEGGNGVREGLRFGLLMAIFNAGYFVATSYGILNIGRRLTLAMAVAGLGEWLLVGATIGLIYRSARGAEVGSPKTAKV